MAADGEADGQLRTNKKRKMKMKKLMFALVAAGAAAVMGDAIESQNIVGYTDKSVSNYEFIGPSFTKVSVSGSENFTYADIDVNCDETGEDGSGWQPLADYIVILNENGTYVRKLVYAPQYIAEAFECTRGWYDDDDVANDDYSTCWNNLISYAPSEGFQMCATVGVDATVTIRSALAAE